MRALDYKTMMMPIGHKVKAILTTEGTQCHYDADKKTVDEAIDFLFSTFMPYILMAEKQGEHVAWSKGIGFRLHENGIASVDYIDENIEHVRIPEAIRVDNRYYLVTDLSIEEPNHTLKQLHVNSGLQEFGIDGLISLRALETVICDDCSLFKTIDNQLYEVNQETRELNRLIWVRPDDKMDTIYLPMDLADIYNKVFVNCPNLHFVKGADSFFSKYNNKLYMYGNRRIMLADRNEYEIVNKWSAYDDVEYHVVLKRINNNENTLQLNRDIDGEIFVHGVDLEEVCESVEKINLYGFERFLGPDKKLPCNFILDKTKLPNLKTIDAALSNWDSDDTVWIHDLQYNNETVPYLLEHNGLLYTYDGVSSEARTRSGCDFDSGNHVSGVFVLPESIEHCGNIYILTSIAPYSFDNHLTSIKIPSSVREIEKKAFWDCNGLRKVEIDEGVKSIGEEAFAFCVNLKQINLPNSIESIDDSAFIGCEKLKTDKV